MDSPINKKPYLHTVLVCVVFLLAFLGKFSSFAVAQTTAVAPTEAPPPVPSTSEATLTTARADLAQEMADVQRTLESATQEQDSTAIPQLQAVRESLEHLDRLCTQQLMRQIADEHEKVLKYPEPIVLFTEFGDSSLNFEVHFWK